MKKLNICMISMLLTTAGSATAFSFPGKETISSSYDIASYKVSQNRGKAGIIMGVMGVVVANKLLNTSVGKKLKSFVKRACSNVWNFFRGLFVGND